MRKIGYYRRLLAVIISFCLVFTMAIPSFASVGGDGIKKPDATHQYSGSGETLNYVAIGDSQANGYFMEGFFKKDKDGNYIKTPGSEDDILDSSGFDIFINGTYPELFAKHLAQTTGRPVDYYQYAMSAIRYEDLHKILDPDAKSDDYYKLWFSETGKAETDKYKDPVNYFGKSYYDASYNPIGTYDTIHNNYTWAIQNADVISLALGINNFGNFLASRLLATVSGDKDDAYAQMNVDRTAYLSLTDKQKQLFNKYYDKVLNLIKSMVGEKNKETLEKVEGLAWDLVYALTGFSSGYDNCLNDIKELNPDATLVIVGMSNVTEGLVITFKEQGVPISVDLGKIIGVLVDAGNLYLAAEGAKSGMDVEYVSPGSFDKTITNIGKQKNDEVNFNSIEELLIGYSVGYFVKNYGKEIFGSDITEKMLKQKAGSKPEDKEYVLDKAKVQASVNRILKKESLTADDVVGQVYLGLRDAIIYAAKNTSKIDLLDALPVFSQDSDAVNKLAESYKNDASSTIREKVFNTFSQKGISDFMYICARILVHSAGSHINADGHADVAERVIEAYDQHERIKKSKEILKKAVPVLVGGVIVTYVAKNVGKRILTAATAAALLKKIQTTFGQRKSSLFGLSSIWNN